MLLMDIDSSRVGKLRPSLGETVKQLLGSFESIPAERRVVLERFAKLINRSESEKVKLIFVCTHNSRRSHVTMIWAYLAAYLYGKREVITFSGGTEVTAFNARAIAALERAGFSAGVPDGTNPVIEIGFGDAISPLSCFSKVVDDAANPKAEYVAVMTCAHADENCPYLPGARQRFALRYTDPGYADGTIEEAQAYDKLVEQVGREMLYVFGMVE